ncbi:MurR/RpiR family transcriptional regulator [Halomonas dongshanensis]|uniref:MurR/RpiR family transcriptional regulator n=1 Tax=Halomonas dongshanensis TaxID=2890835 RepID=UPI0031F41647
MSIPPHAAKPHIGQRITQQYADLSAQEQRVASFILDHFDDLATFSAADLARLTGVSKSTVSRLFKRLGFESFASVKTHARSLRALGVPLVTEGAGGGEERFKRHVARETDNLSRLYAGLSSADFEAVVTALDGARRVTLIGFRNSYPLAMHFRQQLVQVRDDVTLAPQPNQTLAEELVSLQAQDLVVVFGFRRRPQVFERLMALLAQRESRVLLIGDATAGDQARWASWWIECPLDSVSAFDSYASAMSLVCLLTNALLQRRLAQGRARIDAISTLFDALDELALPLP